MLSLDLGTALENCFSIWQFWVLYEPCAPRSLGHQLVDWIQYCILPKLLVTLQLPAPSLGPSSPVFFGVLPKLGKQSDWLEHGWLGRKLKNCEHTSVAA